MEAGIERIGIADLRILSVGIPVIGYPMKSKGNGGGGVTSPAILTERGGFFLQENGGRMLLEESVNNERV